MDHVIQEIESQFSPMAQTASKLLGLVPAVTCERDIDMAEVVQLYHNDMPSPELFLLEHVRWKVRYLVRAVSEGPSSFASALIVIKTFNLICTLYYK